MTNTVEYTKTQRVFNELAEELPTVWLLSCYAVGVITAFAALIAFGNLALTIPSGLGYKIAWDLMWDQGIQHKWAAASVFFVVVALAPTVGVIIGYALYVAGYRLRHGHLPPSKRGR